MHTFKNFKNFEYAEIDLSKPMTLLIGRNGSGKSNLIEGVRLLTYFINGGKFSDVYDVGYNGLFEIRGGLGNCFKKNTTKFEIGFKEKHPIQNNDVDINFKIKFNSDIRVLYEGECNNFDEIAIHCNELTQYPAMEDKVLNNIKEANKNSISTTFRKEYLEKYSRLIFFDINVMFARGYSNTKLIELRKDCSNISSVLYYLNQNEPDILENILNRIKQLPEEEFVSFEFITTSDNSDVLFALKYPNGEIISAKLLSDGTLRALAILTALETVPEGSRIIIEEIDNGVHASRVHVLIEAIWEASNRRHLNTLITTHNPATLDSLNDEQLECVVVCHYDKQSQSAKLTPFFELPRVGVLLQKGKLGGLVTRNVIERYLDPDSAQERKKIALESLEACR
jgi:AAA15 family ATPase/GTPase